MQFYSTVLCSVLMLASFGCGVRATAIHAIHPPEIQPGGQLKLHWLGPDHPEDFIRFGGIKGYVIHWSTSSKEGTSNFTCGSILDEHGRPDDKYENRITVPATDPGCAANVIAEFVPGHPEYGTRMVAHECTFTATGLPLNIPLYLTVSAYMDEQYWGCPSKEITRTIPF